MQRPLVFNLAIFLLLLGWSLLPGVLRGWTMLPLWIACTALVFTGSLEAARLRRRVWLDQYLLAASPWHRVLRGGSLMVAWHLFIGALLSLFMLIKLQSLAVALWVVLALGLPLIAWLLRSLGGRLQKHVLPQARPVLVRRFTVPVAVCVLTALYLVVTLSLGQPDVRGLNWDSAVTQHLQQSSSQFAPLRFLERLYMLLELTLQWALQNALGGTERNGGLAVVGWSLLLLSGSAFIWAYVRLMVGADALFSQRRDVSLQEPS